MKTLIACALMSILFLPLMNAEDNPIIVVCTTTALETLAEAVGKENVDVISLVQPGVCPSHFDVRPSHITEISQASLVLYHGVEPWLEDLIKASQNETVEKVLVQGPWNTPDSAVEKIAVIRNALSQIDPEHANSYTKNAEAAVEEINIMADAMKKEAQELKVDTITVLCMDWQKSFVEWMGFDVASSYAPPETLSIKDVNDLIATGRREGAVLVIDNLQSGTELGSEIAAQIDAYHVVLTNFPGAVPETDTVSKMLEYNARQLLDAVNRYNGEKGRISELESQLREERLKKEFFEVVALVLLVICMVEAVVFYVRR